MTDPINAVLKELVKKHDVRIGPMSDVVSPVVGLSTGNLAIDHITGVGGLPMGRVTEVYGQPSSGKAQPLDALVLTPAGFIKMGEVQPGTVVCTASGGVASVAGVYPQPCQAVYALKFSDGTACEASAQHLWQVEVWTPGFGHIPATVTTDQLQHRARILDRPRTKLCATAPAVMDSSGRVPLDPYLLGLLLGDGGLSGKAVLFTTKDPELLDAVRERIPASCSVEPQSARVASISWRINGIQEPLRQLGLLGTNSATKFVPETYLNRSVQDRLALLQGLMDTDGHASSGTYNAGHGTAEFTSVSRQLRDDVMWLARSLGLKALVGKDKRGSYRDAAHTKIECKMSYRVRIYQTDDVRVFRLPRKLKPIMPGLHYNRDLVSVEYVRDAECQCIALDGPDKLYLTNDFIPTHNTTTALQAAAGLQQRIIATGSDDRILYLDHEHAMDKDYAAALGLDVEHPSFLLSQPNWLEQGAEAAIRLVATGRIRLAIWDSVAEMTPRAGLEADFDQRTGAMNRARLMKELLGKMTPLLAEHNCAGVFVNHLMEAIDIGGGGRPGMPAQETSPGGKALKFYASLRLAYRQIKNIKGAATDALSGEATSQVVATHVRVKVTKNKVGNPFREAEVRVRFGTGFDNAWSAFQVLVAHKRINAGAGGYYYFDKDAAPLAHVDMPVSATGRPHLRGEPSLLLFADDHEDWRGMVIDTAVKLIDEYGGAALAPRVPDGAVADPLALSATDDDPLSELLGDEVI